MKDKNHMIISTDEENALDKIYHPFTIKNSQQIVYRRNVPQHIKAIYDKPTGNITLNGKRLKTVPLRSETRQEGQLLPLLFNIVLEGLPWWCSG